jgi:hypothetical protein
MLEKDCDEDCKGADREHETMSGHFEMGIWIEDPKPPIEPMVMKVKISVDDSDIQRAKQGLEAIHNLFTISLKKSTDIQACTARMCANNIQLECHLKQVIVDDFGHCTYYRLEK